MAVRNTYPIYRFSDVRVLLNVGTLLVAICAVLVALRFASRIVRQQRLGADDWCSLVALSGVIQLIVHCYLWALWGMGMHMAEIGIPNVSANFKVLVAFEFVYGLSIAAVKCSYLAFYLRVFPQKRFQTAVYWCLGLIVAIFIANALQIFLICRPVAGNWDPLIPGLVCGSRPISFAIIGALNMVTDLIIILLPLPLVLGLQMDRRTKWGLCLMFGLGFSITAVSIIRMLVMLHLDFYDMTYSMQPSAAWTVLETTISIINSCIPMLRPILMHAVARVRKHVPCSNKTGSKSAGALSSEGGFSLHGFKSGKRNGVGGEGDFDRISDKTATSKKGGKKEVGIDTMIDEELRRDVEAGRVDTTTAGWEDGGSERRILHG
ncbi:uncharacterized protein K452DRAFT_362205 [Aplosporella prunicola CBS 121167]|uniref:Rhodopsin domain-containing protein n=1 Tax=Aplosporella prunicola CBS 121167 TaxID=1176127 RepID=A0A6A6B124_9PEZI|nr:uncharacterized protein K452DRAFT_362205 [Aplosporella prunicola CBS 121167]KAF2136955.1 hypothetical protein K452DRAFT_362205 [Aplosporella prunicola CBS 121167]